MLDATPVTAQDGVLEAVHDTTLSNGLRVAVFEDDDSPLVTALVAIRNGAASQMPETRGLAHLFEHLLFRSYQRGGSSFGQDAGEIQASYNGTTDRDLVTYYIVAPSDRAERALELLGRLVTNARFDSDDLDAEVPVVLDELARSQSDPLSRLHRQVRSTLWGNDWHLVDAAGDSASLRAASVAVLEQHYADFYVPNNALVVVSGDIAAESAFERIDAEFGDWRTGPPPPTPSLEAPQSTPGLAGVFVADDVFETTVTVSYRLPDSANGEAAQDLSSLSALLSSPTADFQEDLVSQGPFDRLSLRLIRGRVGLELVVEGTAQFGESVDAVSRLLTALGSLQRYAAVAEPSDLDVARKRHLLDVALMRERGPVLAPAIASTWGVTRLDGEAHLEPFADADIEQARRMRAVERLGEVRRVLGVLSIASVVVSVRDYLAGAR